MIILLQGLESIDVSILPPLTVTSITVNNNGNEVAIGCANGGIKIYDLTPGNGGKCTYSCDSKVAALGVFDDPDEVLKTPPTIVTSLAFDVNVEGGGSSRNSQYLTVQHSSGWAGVLNRSSCFRGGEVVASHWHESFWGWGAVGGVGLPSSVGLMTSDGVDSFSIVNEGGGGAATKKHR